MEIDIQDIKNITKGVLLQNPSNPLISEFLTDSRLLLFPSKTIFFAIKTEHNDGHLFIPDLYEKNVRSFLISDAQFPVAKYPDANFIIVWDVIKALQKLAIHHRSQITSNVIGITGSNGKTMVKEWLKQILEPHYRITATPKSYNSQIGVPLSIFQANDRHEIAIFEAGISHPGEMMTLQRMVLPDIGLITHIGDAHGENFPSMQKKLYEKLILFRGAKTIVFNSDQKELAEAVKNFSEVYKIKLFSWGTLHINDLQIRITEESADATELQLYYSGQKFTAWFPFTDKVSIENALHCVAVAICCGMDLNDILEEVKTLKPVALRLELQKGINNCAVINDSYNLDLDSLKSALDFLQHQHGFKKKALILSDILQSDKQDLFLYREVGRLIQEKEISRFIGVGKKIISHKSFFPKESLFFETTDQLIEDLTKLDFHNELILLKGSRTFHFEKISHLLQQHIHETVLEVNLNALAHNFKYFRSKVYPAKIMAMVKAFAYGSGSKEVANALQFYGVNYLVVAYVDEGVALRKAGIHVPIMVMNPENEGFDDLFTYNLEPEIYNFRTLDLLEQAVKKNLFYQSRIMRFHIKLDTGMHRLGFMEKDIDTLIPRLQKLENSKVQSVFSHFAGSDDASMDDFSQKQIAAFTRMSDKIMAALPYKVLRHINNSSAIYRFPESQFDMVRLGIGLYGISSHAEEQLQLLSVNRLFTVISQIKSISKGDHLGYNQGFIAKEDMTIAILPIGYADGLHRSLKNKGKVWINDTLCPMVGNICMDMCMVDISNVEAKEGDRVEVFGENQSLQDFSVQARTIPYEVLTGISPRVKRVYTQE